MDRHHRAAPGLDRGRGGVPLAIDTEADSFHHYREKICLIQLSAGGRHALVDPFGSIELGILREPLEDPRVVKILHGADYDVRLLYRDAGLVFRGLRDTMIAARLSGETALGLAALLDRHLGVTLDKAHQRADWSRRPLPPAMRDYAIEDTRHLERLEGILGDRLEALGRTAWAREECERLEAVRWKDRRDDDPEPFRRVKGASALDRVGLAVLREVWGWRDAMARKRDRPAFRVLRDEPLLAIAKSPPSTIGDLAAVQGFPEPILRSPSARDLVEAARRGAACAEADLPAVPDGARRRLDPAVAARAERIKASRDAMARDLGLDPSVIASRGLVEEIARRLEAGEDPWSAPELRSWQAGLLRGVAG